MKKEPFMTEEDAARKDLARDMKLDPVSQEVSDARLAYSICRKVKSQLTKVHQRYVDMESLMELSKELSGLIGDYDISVMAYEELSKVLHEQPGVIIKVGIPSKKTPFALIDEKTRVVGVYVPKRQRLIYLEKAAQGAVDTWNGYLANFGAVLDQDIADGLKNLLVGYDKYPYKIPQMKIRFGTEREDAREYFTRKGRELKYNLQVTESEVCLIYRVNLK